MKLSKRIYAKIFCMGFFAGIIIMNLGKSILLESTGLFDEYTLYYMKYMTVDSDALFLYVLRERVGKALLLIIFATTYLGLIVCRGYVLWYGFSAGAFVSALVIRYGIKGILLAIVSVMPQYLIYVPAAIALLSWCEALFQGIYNKGEQGFGEKNVAVKRVVCLVGIFMVLTIGCFLEGYINIRLLKGFLKIF